MISDLEDNSDLFDGFGNGSLHMCLVCKPSEPRYIDLDLHFSEWEALFLGALDAHRWDSYIEGEDIQEYEERNRQKFHESIPEFPTLRTIDDMYADYLFDPDRTRMLREECTLLKSRITDPQATRALRKLIYGCDKALEANCSLMFSCD